MKRFLLPLLIIVLGFALPYYWDSITDEKVKLAGYVLCNIVGLSSGLIIIGLGGNKND